MSASGNGERQVAPTLDGIRADHRARYEWVADRERGNRLVDAACGVGYGSKILARAGCGVTAFDRAPEAIEYARAHYNHEPRVRYERGDIETFEAGTADAVVCFEALEHLPEPEVALTRFRDMASRLYVSVPNEDVFPHQGRIRHHYRHYTRTEFDEVLTRTGWRVREWWGQEGPESPVERGVDGRTLVAVCERLDVIPRLTVTPVSDAPERFALPGRDLPESVAIVAMGRSAGEYLAQASKPGSRRRFVDETWVINAQGGVLQHDRLFLMDDLTLQQGRAGLIPNGNVAGQMDWLADHPGPVYTSRQYDEWPGSVGYPIKWVLDRTGHCYFNSTVPYAFAFALALGVKRIHLFGCDYSYSADHAHKRERGRACLEYWIAVASMSQVEVHVPETSTLLDACDNANGIRLYGYDTERMTVGLGPDGFSVEREPLKPHELPRPIDMELRYSHDERIERLAGV